MAVNINYKSDFDFILRLKNAGEDVVPFPDCDWEMRFYTDSIANTYVASCKGGIYTNCCPEGDGIRFVFDGHKLSVGKLKYEFHVEMPNEIYFDGIQEIYAPRVLDIELVPGAGDCGTTAEVEAVLPYIKGDAGPAGPQGPKGDKGDAFTYADFTEAEIEALQRPATEAAEELGRFQAEAEANESERVGAEQQRAEEFALWENKIDSKADRSELSNVLAAEPLTPENFPEVNEYTREELVRASFRDKWLATLAMFPKLPTYDEDVAATLPDGSQYGLNGLVMPYDIAVKVMLWSKPTEMYAPGCYSYDYCLPSDIPTLFPFWGASGTPNLNNAWRACEYVTVLSVYSSIGLIIRPTQATNLFAVCRRLEKIYGIIDLQYIKQSSVTNSIFQLSPRLVSVNVKNLVCDISISAMYMLSLESLDYILFNAANTAAITITVHPDVYAKLTDESNAEWHALLALAAEKNITFATV